MKFPPNHHQRIYVLKTAEATGLPQRITSLICQSPKYATASSSAAAQNSQSVTTPPEVPASFTAARIQVPDKTSPPATRKVHSRAIIEDDFAKCVIRRKNPKNLHSQGAVLPTIDKLLAVLRADIDFKGSRETLMRSKSSTLQKIRQVKKTKIYC